jgi:hypothetical protein
MPMLLIDECGRIEEARSLLREGACADPFELAIAQRGCIGLSVLGGSVRVRMLPRLTSPAALSALCFWLHARPCTRVHLAWEDEGAGWREETIEWSRAGWRRLAALVVVGEDAATFSRQVIAPEALGPGNPLRGLLESWSWSPDDFAGSREALRRVNDRFVLVEEDADHELRICQLGRTMMARSPTWRRNAIGLRVDDLPDWRYGRWVAEAYREVARHGRPLIEIIAAVIRWEDHGPLSHSYWRVILPLKERGAPTLLLGATLDCNALAT